MLGETESTSAWHTSKRRLLRLRVLFCVFICASMLSGIFVQSFAIFNRAELQTINQRFDARRWLDWNASSLKKLNIEKLIKYHDQHDIPRSPLVWDFTLSWLIEDNHPQAKHKFVIFNHSLEDEPPEEAITSFAWMHPLKQRQLSRKTMAEIVEFLANAKVKVIVLDYEFPQYSDDDKILARAIHDSSEGKFGGQKTPVIFVRSISRSSSGNMVVLSVPTSPGGVLEELQKLEPSVDVSAKYTGISGVWQDEDQVVRQIAYSVDGADGKKYTSITQKILASINENVSGRIPQTFDINFAGPPKTDIYPVRPHTYLFDPAIKQQMVTPGKDYQDVTLKDAIVLIGDGVTDVFNTPTTNLGFNQMSGTELIANSVDTVSSHAIPKRVTGSGALLWLLIVSVWGAARFIMVRVFRKRRAKQIYEKSNIIQTTLDLLYLALDLTFLFLASAAAFTYALILVPVIAPATGLVVGNLAAILWEREQERNYTAEVKLRAAEEKFQLIQMAHRGELEAQTAHAEARELFLDKERRREFVRRLEHDLRAPIGVLNWTILRLMKEGISAKAAQDNLERLKNSSDRLNGLIDELTSSYEVQNDSEETDRGCDLNIIVQDCCKLLKPIAEERESTIEAQTPAAQSFANVRKLEISRVIDNLIRNALLHNTSGTEVKVILTSANDEYLIRVTDNGKGIAADKLDKVFDAGFRVNAQESLHKSGQGLGLHIVKTIVESFNGKISVSSQLNTATTFSVILQAKPAPNLGISIVPQGDESSAELTHGDRIQNH